MAISNRSLLHLEHPPAPKVPTRHGISVIPPVPFEISGTAKAHRPKDQVKEPDRAKSRKARHADCRPHPVAISVLLAVLLSELVASGAKAADLPLPAPSRYDADPPYAHWGAVYIGPNGGFGLGGGFNYRFSW
jgi:hypothetical protein